MFFGPQTYNVTNIAISGSAGGAGAVFLTPFSNMLDARSGTVCSMQWGAGTQTLVSYVQLVITLSNPLGGTPRAGIVHIANVKGLPAGTLIDLQVGTYVQRLIAGRRGELGAIFIPTTLLSTTTITIRIYNDVNGAASISASTVFAIGEILVAPLIPVPLLIDDSPPVEIPVDPTAWTRSAGGQLWQYQRKPFSQISFKAGRFLTTDAVGGSLFGKFTDGLGNNIDARTLLYTLATCGLCSYIAIPHQGFKEGMLGGIQKAAGGGYFNQGMIQMNAMLSRPSNIKELSMDKFPYWGFAADMMEAT